MLGRRAITAVATAAVVAGALSAATSSALPVAAKDSVFKKAVRGQLRPAKLPITVTTGTGQARVQVQTYRTMPFFSGGTLDAAKFALEPDAQDTAGDTGNPATGSGGGNVTPARLSGNGDDNNGRPGTLGIAADTLGCSRRNTNGDVRVNQDCSFRRQAEEMIAYNYSDPSNLVGGQNDSRVGYNQCGIDWSIDNGQHWGDLLPPFRQRLNAPEFMGPTATNPNNNTIAPLPGTFHTYDAGSDPAIATDSQGRTYFSCVMFDVASNASGLYVTQSPKGSQGSFYFNVPAPPSKNFMVVEDNNPVVAHDKNMIVADHYKNSPNRDNVYVTWTIFRFSESGSYQQSPIFGSMSTDHALTWSTPEDISGTSDALCFFGDAFEPSLSPHKCDFDQGSNPTVLPNGDLEVVFNNGNTPAGNPNGQTLGVHCHPTGSSTNGTAHLNCVEPAKVGDDIIAGEPQCDFGRGPEECIPGAYIRTNDFPNVSKNTQNNHLYATWQDYRNGEFDIQLSQSLDGGLTWHEVGTVNPDRGLDHYFPAVEQSPDSRGDRGDRSNGENNGSGDRVGDSYYRTQRVANENATPSGGFAPGMPGVQQGNSDYVLAGGTDGNTPYSFKVISPKFPPPDGIQAGFNGDYSGLTINRGVEAHPIWSDTRNADPYAPANGVMHDEDVFTIGIPLPNGRDREREGRIGSD